MKTHPELRCLWKRVSIICWNDDGALHFPKYMTKGSKRPQLVMKAAFHLSPSLILILLNPHQMSMTVKCLAVWNLGFCKILERKGRRYRSGMVCLLRYR